MSELSFTAREIQSMLPHKFPFLLLDGANNIKHGISAEGHKNYTINEWFFQGHFPGEPIVPGVLLIESMAQLVAIVYLSELFIGKTKQEIFQSNNSSGTNAVSARVGYLIKSDVKFSRPVTAGERLDMQAKIIKKMGPLSQVKVVGKIGRAEAVSGILSVSERPE